MLKPARRGDPGSHLLAMTFGRMGSEHTATQLELTDGSDMEQKIKHLELIQGVVNRLATNSFRMKGWSVVLIAALFAFFAREGDNTFVPIGFVPVLFFWGLDGYFCGRRDCSAPCMTTSAFSMKTKSISQWISVASGEAAMPAETLCLHGQEQPFREH